jgi:hypothetical protein
VDFIIQHKPKKDVNPGGIHIIQTAEEWIGTTPPLLITP